MTKDPNVKKADKKRFQLLWRAGYSTGDSLSNRIIVGGDNAKLNSATRQDFVKGVTKTGAVSSGQDAVARNLPVDNDYIQKYLEYGNTHDIMLPFNTKICFAQEYTPQITNKISSYSTLAGNSIVSFGQNIRKIGLKVTILKAGKFWIPYSTALEAFTVMSGSPSRYLGSLFLHSFDQSNPAESRKYRVVVESLTPVYRQDRNTTVDFDMSMLVTYDYSTDKFGRWGRLI